MASLSLSSQHDVVHSMSMSSPRPLLWYLCLCYSCPSDDVGASNDANSIMNDAASPQGATPQSQQGEIDDATPVPECDLGGMACRPQAAGGDANRERDGTIASRCWHSVTLLPQTWPRLYAITFRVALPLLCLIGLALIFGYFLAKLEAPWEIEDNNLSIAYHHAIYQAILLEESFLRVAPMFCVSVYFEFDLQQQQKQDIEDYFVEIIESETVESETTPLLNQIAVDTGVNETVLSDHDKDFTLPGDIPSLLAANNVTQIDDLPMFLQSITECGNMIGILMKNLSTTHVMNEYHEIDSFTGRVSFYWIRCPDSVDANANMTGGQSLWRHFTDVFRFSAPDHQETEAKRRWLEGYQSLFDEKYDLYTSQNMNKYQARQKASSEAHLAADGFEGCIPDTNSAAWFWFTVMTTIGYGNAAPVTLGGRLMVIFFGFVCILTFGLVVTKAGDIVATIFEDLVNRQRKLKFLTNPWAELLVWLALMICWMCIFSLSYVSFNKRRTGEVTGMGDAFWFSFITVTTVGLGDLYFDNATILFWDVVALAFLILLGFVLFANVITILSVEFKNLWKSQHVTLKERLDEQSPAITMSTIGRSSLRGE